MARPKIGLFGALFAVGGVLAWKWAQNQRATPRRMPRELTRWEDEGGKVITPSTASTAKRPVNGGNGTLGGTPDAWNFPRS